MMRKRLNHPESKVERAAAARAKLKRLHDGPWEHAGTELADRWPEEFAPAPEPTANGSNGNDRGSNGRFLPGNPGGPGSPLAAKTHEYRAALMNALDADDVRRIA